MHTRFGLAIAIVAIAIVAIAADPSPSTAQPAPSGGTVSPAASVPTDLPSFTGDLLPTRTFASADGESAASALAATIVDAASIDTAYAATAEALARAGIRIETTTHVLVEPVAPAATSSMWPRQVLEAALEAQNRRYVDRISATDAGTMLATMGWPFPADAGTPGEGWVAFLQAWLADAHANPGDPTSFAPLFAAEMIRLGDGVDLATARAADVHFGLLELLVISAGFERVDATSAAVRLAVARPPIVSEIRLAVARPPIVSEIRLAAEGPCDSTLERFGIPPDTGLVNVQAPAWMQKGAVGLLGVSSTAAKAAMKAIKAFQKIWRAAAFYFYSFVRVEASDKRLHKPNEEDDPEIFTTFTAKTGVDPDAFKEWVRDNGGPNGVRELNDDTRCAEALGMPIMTDLDDVADDAANWIVEWTPEEGMPDHADEAIECGSTPTSTCNRFDRHQPALGMKLRKTGASVAEADLFVRIKDEEKHGAGAVEREVPVTVRASIDSSTMPTISPFNLTNPAGLIGPGLETIAGLVQSSFKPSSKATLIVTYHEALGWTYLDATPLGDIKGVKCDDAAGEWTVQGEQTLRGGKVTNTTSWNVKFDETIDEKTLAGRYKYEAIQKAGPTLTTGNAKGKAGVVLNDDGSAKMTLSASPIKTTITLAGKSQTVKLSPQGWTFDWKPATAGECP